MFTSKINEKGKINDAKNKYETNYGRKCKNWWTK